MRVSWKRGPLLDLLIIPFQARVCLIQLDDIFIKRFLGNGIFKLKPLQPFIMGDRPRVF